MERDEEGRRRTKRRRTRDSEGDGVQVGTWVGV